MDELDELYFGRSSLYNPKDDKRYADLTKVQEDFNFAEEWNKGTSSALARDTARQNLAQGEIELQDKQRSNDLEKDLIDSLAKTNTPEEVEDVLRQVAIRNGSVDLLDKIEVRKNRKRDQTLQEVGLLKEADQTELAARRVMEDFGYDIPAEKFKKDPKILGGGYFLGEDGVATPIPGIKRPDAKRPSVTVFNQKTGATRQVPYGSPVPPDYSQVPPSDKQLAERKANMDLMVDAIKKPKRSGGGGRVNSPDNLTSTPKKRVPVRERQQ